MEELQEIPLEIFKPITIKIRLNGWANRGDGKYVISWFDNTLKVLDYDVLQYYEYDFNLALQQVAEIYKRNQKSIKSIKLSTI